MERRFRALVFDWDGTLVDSIGNIVDCTLATMEELGMPGVDAATIRSAIGTGLRETVEAFCPECDDQLFNRIVAAYRQLWFTDFGRRHQLFAGVGSMLDQLEESGYLLAVATAKSRRGLLLDLERTGLGRHFLATRTADESASKPSPQMLFEILDELGTQAGESLMIGDSEHDMAMAHNAKVPAVAVASGSSAHAEFKEWSPLVCLNVVTELPAWLAAATGDRG